LGNINCNLWHFSLLIYFLFHNVEKVSNIAGIVYVIDKAYVCQLSQSMQSILEYLRIVCWTPILHSKKVVLLYCYCH
jgi:hypothetical protein